MLLGTKEEDEDVEGRSWESVDGQRGEGGRVDVQRGADGRVTGKRGECGRVDAQRVDGKAAWGDVHGGREAETEQGGKEGAVSRVAKIEEAVASLRAKLGREPTKQELEVAAEVARRGKVQTGLRSKSGQGEDSAEATRSAMRTRGGGCSQGCGGCTQGGGGCTQGGGRTGGAGAGGAGAQGNKGKVVVGVIVGAEEGLGDRDSLARQEAEERQRAEVERLRKDELRHERKRASLLVERRHAM